MIVEENVKSLMRNLTVYQLILILSISGNCISLSQTIKTIPRDDYFTIEKVYEKVRKTYPYIKRVDTTLSSNLILKLNVVYKRIGTRELTVDIFSPKNNTVKKLLPCILIFHGGGWRSGSKEMEHPLAAKLAEKGFVTVTVEYRLSPEAKYPAAVLDAKSAIRWVRANFQKYSIDTSKICVMGSSAGAQLATLIGVTPNSTVFPVDDDLNTSDEVKAIINIDGEVDFTHPDACDVGQTEGKPSSASKWFGGNFLQVPELWREASPINYVTEKCPPIFFINSSLKENHAGQDEMRVKLDKIMIPYDVFTFSEAPHPFWLFHPWFYKNVEEIADFLKNYLIDT